MMKVLGLTLLLIAMVAAAPTREQQQQPDDCIKGCITGVLQYGEELNILKNPNLSKYFSKLDEVCGVISTARQCVEACGASKNPFALDSLNIVCDPANHERLTVIKQCLQYIDHNIDETCTKECTTTAQPQVVDETDVTPKMNPFMQKANDDCVAFKCMSRCSIQVVGNECGKEMGKELQGLLQFVLDTQHEDLTKLNLIEAMTKSTPPQCNYLYDPSVLFGGEEKKGEEKTHDPAEDAKTLYAQAQLQLLLKQIELTEKQDRLVDRENAKLDMEMAYMAQKVHQREAAAVQHAVPVFIPSKDEMPMEPKQPQPEEPHHPEEPPRPPMPMEAPLPHPELPSSSHKIPKEPVIPLPSPAIEGMPMDQQVPMEFIPMHIPMEAMPRFF